MGRITNLFCLVFLSLGAVTRRAVAATTDLEPGNGWLMPRDVSLHGWRIDRLINVTMGFVTILFVIMTIWMLYAVVKHNADHTAMFDHGSAKGQVAFALGLSAAIFLVVDGNLFVNSTWDTSTVFWNFERAASHPQALKIEINARQWAWDIRYPGPDGVFNTSDDIITLNDLRIPQDVPVLVQLSASDVLHAFYLPHLRVKIDAVPGTVNQVWFQATQAGKFEIGCAQHCGMAHYNMRGVLTVLPQQDYEQWAEVASLNAQQLYNDADTQAHWGWPWQTREL